MILVPTNKSVNDTIAEHRTSNCTHHLLSSLHPSTRKKCIWSDCRSITEASRGENSFVIVVCDGCGGIFCLKHRYPAAHNCASLNVTAEAKAKRRENADIIIAEYRKASEARSLLNSTSNPISITTTKSASTIKPKKKGSKLIEVMKMKSKAQGEASIPQDARIYVSVSFPRDYKILAKPLFFNKNWTIGKVLDQIAVSVKIRNVNNQLTPDNLEYLVLLNKETGEILEMARKFGDLVESGAEILLEKQSLIGEYTLNN
ncbi:hypothetical protein G9A89_002805 [Geosiphon pyriformis]|nr:hypothetical protein G9A89_002805 [Geosiphon pyriformis]